MQHRFAYWRWADILVQNFNRRTKVEFCTPFDTNPFSLPIANLFVVCSAFCHYTIISAANTQSFSFFPGWTLIISSGCRLKLPWIRVYCLLAYHGNWCASCCGWWVCPKQASLWSSNLQRELFLHNGFQVVKTLFSDWTDKVVLIWMFCWIVFLKPHPVSFLLWCPLNLPLTCW